MHVLHIVQCVQGISYGIGPLTASQTQVFLITVREYLSLSLQVDHRVFQTEIGKNCIKKLRILDPPLSC